jgi:hypothetical protein
LKSSWLRRPDSVTFAKVPARRFSARSHLAKRLGSRGSWFVVHHMILKFTMSREMDIHTQKLGKHLATPGGPTT